MRNTQCSQPLSQQVRKEWTGMARKSCDPLVKAYWLCRNDNGLGVIFKCRRQLADMNTCLGSWSSDPSLYEEYAAKRLPQLQGGFAAGKPNPKYFDEEGNRLVPAEFAKKPKSRH